VEPDKVSGLYNNPSVTLSRATSLYTREADKEKRIALQFNSWSEARIHGVAISRRVYSSIHFSNLIRHFLAKMPPFAKPQTAILSSTTLTLPLVRGIALPGEGESG